MMPYTLKFTASFLQRKIGIVMKSDILIIGGGIIGLSIARELDLRGIERITVLDKSNVGVEASWAAAGMLAPSSETEKDDDFYRLCSASNRLYPQFADELLSQTGVDIEFDPSGTLYLAFNEHDLAEIESRYQAQNLVGINISKLDRAQIMELEPNISSQVRSGLLYPDDRQVENRKLLTALQTYAKNAGIKIIENCEAASIKLENGNAVGVLTNNGEFTAGHIIITTGAWTSLIKLEEAAMPFAVKPIRGQMMSFKAEAGLISKVIYSPRGYVLPRRDGRIITGATVEDAGFSNVTTEDGIALIKRNAAEILPVTASLEAAEIWSGLRPMSGDGHPVLGGIPGINGVTVATGHYRNGILLAPLTAQLIANSILDGENGGAIETFGPARLISATSVAGN